MSEWTCCRCGKGPEAWDPPGLLVRVQVGVAPTTPAHLEPTPREIREATSGIVEALFAKRAARPSQSAIYCVSCWDEVVVVHAAEAVRHLRDEADVEDADRGRLHRGKRS